MGQYHLIANVDKKEYLMPHDFGDGLKLMEFGLSAEGTLAGLAILLSVSNDRGGGDLHVTDEVLAGAIIGRWAGDRLAIVGDYAEPDDMPWYELPADKLWEAMGEENEGWMNISNLVMDALMMDYGFASRAEERKRNGFMTSDPAKAYLKADGTIGVPR